MLKCIRENTPCLPNRWIEFVLRHPLPVVLIALLATMAVLRFTVANFRVDTDVTEMISSELPFRKAHLKYLEAFPELRNRLVLVVEASTPETARYSREVLARRLQAAEGLFRSVYVPGGGPFFAKNGLLYLSVTELEDLSDNLAEVQPFLGMLPEELTLESFFAMLADFVRQGGDEILDNERILLLFANLAEAMESAADGELRQLSWQEVMLGQDVDEAQLREFVMVQPVLDYSSLYPAGDAIAAIRRLTDEVSDEPAFAGVRLRLTGSLALRQADLESVQSGTKLAAAISFILVTLFLILGLRSGWLVLASLFTLLTGLAWTMGFAIGAIGSLNLISIAFVVLFIGLGVDYSIQICLRLRELLDEGNDRSGAIRQAVAEIGNPLLLCTITTAIGFYAFVPTAYAGASELGIISGTGMFLFLFANITLLPALLRLLPLKKPTAARGHGIPFDSLPRRFGRPILVVAGLLAVASLFTAPFVSFDYSPLVLSNPRAEAVIAARELFTTGRTSPWTITVLEDNLNQARQTASRLEQLEEVEMALTIADFVPDHQEEKLAIIDDTALFMPPLPGPPDLRRLDIEPSYAALAALDRELAALNNGAPGGPPRPAPADKLANATDRLLALRGSTGSATALALLNRGVLFNLGVALDHLDTMLQPQPVALADLPAELVTQFVSPERPYRIQVFPRRDLTEIANLESFVAAVRTMAPRATDTPVNILETGNAIIGSFQRAALYALALITLFLLAVLRHRRETALILIPLLLAILYTAAASVLFSIPFNYANVIVIPLLLGIGIDYGIHLIFRFRSGLAGDRHLLETSTARAVLFSALTTIMSFSSLSFSTHRGTASMGILLTICNLLMIVCTLTILPAILSVFSGSVRRQAREDPE